MSDHTARPDGPFELRLEAGRTYWWCRCGRTQDPPLCDGSHGGSGIEPLPFRAERSETVWLCACGRTGNPPYCDGSHAVEAQPARPDENGHGRERINDPVRARIAALADSGRDETVSMGPSLRALPDWNGLQLLAAQLHRRPLPAEAGIDTRLVLGPRAARPLELPLPILIADMSLGALSPEARLALAQGARRAGAAWCSGEGGVLPGELAANPACLFEYGPAGFGWSEALAGSIRAFHFKAGQAAKTGIGARLPAEKVSPEIARLRGVPEGRDVISPPTFPTLRTPRDFRRFADRVRALSGGVPIGFKLSAQHIEDDLAFAVEAGCDYVVLDGRGGATGAAPRLFRDHFGVPSMPALVRARRWLDRHAPEVTLIVSGGLRLPEDFAKALALGADGVAIGSAALQAMGCREARLCHTGRCPVGIATQEPGLRARFDVAAAAARLQRFLSASLESLRAVARACGHDRLSALSRDDLVTCDPVLARLCDVRLCSE